MSGITNIANVKTSTSAETGRVIKEDKSPLVIVTALLNYPSIIGPRISPKTIGAVE